MRVRKIGLIVGAPVLALATAWVGVRSAADETPPAPRVHTDPEAMAEGVVDAFEALLREDLGKAGKAIQRLNESCKRLGRDADETFARGFFNRDQALHKVLDGTMGFIRSGRAEDAYTEFVWVTRTCRECHGLAREAGLLPAEGPLWAGPAGAEERVETTHTQGQKP